MDKIYQGNFSLRDMYEQFENILKMGPLNKVMEMIPGFSNLLKQTGGANVRLSVGIEGGASNVFAGGLWPED